MHLSPPPVATAAVHSKVVALLSLIHCMLLLPLYGSGCCFFSFVVLLDFSLSVKAAPHECVIRTSQH